MTTLTNTFKKRMLIGDTQFGYWLAMANAYTAEITATAGFDWLLIDGEHAPNDIRSMLAQLQAIAPYPVSPIVRALEGTTANIKQLLDIGAHNILVPMVESAKQARQIVAATKYPPRGNRGVGAAIARSSKWMAIQDYSANIEEDICLILQIESVAGLENLEEILLESGYDAIFIGPSDLAASMGHGGDTAHPNVQKAITDACRKAQAAGKHVGILSTEEHMIKQYLEQGISFIAVGVDTISYAHVTRSLAQRYTS